MRKIVSCCVVLMLVFTSCFFLTTSAVKINNISKTSKTITVDDDGDADFKKISTAITFANAGDKIYVYSGTYKEFLSIEKPLTIVGENKATTIIDPIGTGFWFYAAIISETSDVTIKGFTFKNNIGNTIIEISHSTNVKIEDNVFVTTSGIYVTGSSSCTVIENSVKGGIALRYGAKRNTVKNNILHGELLIYKSDDNEIYRNTITGKSSMIRLEGANGNHIYHNNIIKSGVSIDEPIRTEGKNYNNRWDNDYPSGGNYYSWISKVDDDNDGIVDYSYNIDNDNIDYYPWMNKNGKSKSKSMNNIFLKIFEIFPVLKKLNELF